MAKPGSSAPLKIIAFTNDALMPPKSVAKLAQRYPTAEITEVVIDPQDYGFVRNRAYEGVFTRKQRDLVRNFAKLTSLTLTQIEIFCYIYAIWSWGRRST